MSTPGPPTSPGWYPSPDGNGQQWWNGTTWSDARRTVDGSAPVLGGLPGYQAAPPSATMPDIPPPAPTSGAPRIPSLGNPATWFIPIVFSIIGFTVYNLFGVIALIAGLAMFRASGTIGRVIIAISFVISIASIVSGVISFVGGARSIEEIIF